jgi:hypothetical protein
MRQVRRQALGHQTAAAQISKSSYPGFDDHPIDCPCPECLNDSDPDVWTRRNAGELGADVASAWLDSPARGRRLARRAERRIVSLDHAGEISGPRLGHGIDGIAAYGLALRSCRRRRRAGRRRGLRERNGRVCREQRRQKCCSYQNACISSRALRRRVVPNGVR